MKLERSIFWGHSPWSSQTNELKITGSRHLMFTHFQGLIFESASSNYQSAFLGVGFCFSFVFGKLLNLIQSNLLPLFPFSLFHVKHKSPSKRWNFINKIVYQKFQQKSHHSLNFDRNFNHLYMSADFNRIFAVYHIDFDFLLTNDAILHIQKVFILLNKIVIIYIYAIM